MEMIGGLHVWDYDDGGKDMIVEWRSALRHVCIVAVGYVHARYWQAYMSGVLREYEGQPTAGAEEFTIRMTHTMGYKLTPEEAQVFFPQLRMELYKTTPDRETPEGEFDELDFYKR